MKTRRKSYQDTAEGETTSSQVAEETEESTLSISPDFDVDYLAQNFPHIEDWTRPSAASISQVYTALAEILKERDVAQENAERLQAELEKKEIELDQTLQDRENETKELEASLESAKNDLNTALKERDQLGALFVCSFFHNVPSPASLSAASEASLQVEVTRLASQNTTSSAELDGSKRQIEDVEREKRDLLGVISRLKQENTERDGLSRLFLYCYT
jgi:nucleoprotein TPR